MSTRITILGLGLMGGSLWRKLAAEGHQVTGYDVDRGTREEAKIVASTMSNRNADRVVDTVPAAVVGAEIVVICVPVPDVPEVLHAVHEAGYRGLLTDVTSVKGPIQDIIDRKYPATRWVGGHPMVGFERAGFFASTSRMYDDCPWVLCIDEDAKPATAMRDWLTMATLLTSIGCRVVPVTAAEHDQAVARVSHVPHLVASALTQLAAATPLGHLSLTLGAGSFRDGTRVAAARPDRTAAFCGWNASALASELEQLIGRLTQARTILRGAADPTAALHDWLWPGHVVRSTWPPEPGTETTFSALPARLLELGRSGGWVTKVDGHQITGVQPLPTPLR